METKELNKSFGYTTGSCAAAASKAAAYMLLSGKQVDYVNLITPGGYKLELELFDVEKTDSFVSCAVRKNSGEDPDITNGVLVYAKVEALADSETNLKSRICIEGGIGIGRVTKPGLDQPVGEWAINSGPRKMITAAMQEVAEEFGYHGALKTIISIPDGVHLAQSTFNPKLGIEGGISILGTTGIVEPMSEQALLDTIRVELSVKKAEGNQLLWIAPGNYGQTFLQEQYGFEIDHAVKCSNFIGDTMQIARSLDFQNVILTGHLGKLVKVAAGIMNTHSKYGDHRMDTIVQVMEAVTDAPEDLKQQILGCVSTEEAVRILREAALIDVVMPEIAARIQHNLLEKTPELNIQIILFSSEYGLLAQTDGVEQFLR